MHCICVVYSSSQYYNSPARIIVLLQETCNLLVEAARKYLDPNSLFQVSCVQYAKEIENDVFINNLIRDHLEESNI